MNVQSTTAAEPPPPQRKPVRPVDTPTILQMEALECGAASLAMVLAYHGRWIPLEELRTLCGVSRDGSKALNIVKAARALGMKAEGRRKELADLDELPVPAILFVNLNHFVVLEGVSARGFHVNDPAGGKRVIGPDEFDGMFSGIALVFEPTERFQTGGAPRRVLPALVGIARGTAKPIALVVLAGVMAVVLSMITPAFSRIFLDKILIGRLDDWVIPLLVVMALVAPLVAILSYVRARMVTAISIKLSIVLSGRMVWHVLRLPVSFFGQRYAGMVTSRIGLAEEIGRMAAQDIGEALVNVTMVVAFSILMLQYNVPLTLLCIAVALGNVLLFRHLRKALGEASEKVALQSVKMQGKAMQGLQMIETLKATGTDGMFFSNWAGLQALFINAQQQIARREALLAALPALTGAVTSAAVLMVGGYYTMVDDFTIGMLVAFTTILASFTSPVESLVGLATRLQQFRGNLAQVDDTLCHPQATEFTAAAAEPEIRPARTTARLKRLSGHLQLDNVTFGYSPLEAPLIENFSLEMVPGSRVALVGGSGSGKSTVGKLVVGLLEPKSGQVVFDGTPLPQVPRDVLRNSVAIVEQDVVLFQGTIRDNIAMWDDTMFHEHVVEAAKDAMIHDAIVARKAGYDAQVAENGRNFSGGQRQRLEIARALACNPSLLVLDEATSALDPLTEKAIVDNLRRRGCSCLIIAHRLSTIRDCDEIIVMHRGKVLQRGAHDALMAQDGPYRRLIET